MAAGFISGWLGFFIIALLLAGLTAVFAKVALAGLSAPQTVLISGITILVLSFTTLSFNGFFKSARHFSQGSIIDLTISGVLTALGCICLLLAFQMTEVSSTAPFYLLIPVFIFVVNTFLNKKMPAVLTLVVCIVLTVGVFMMGFGVKHRHGSWWIFALLGPAFLAADKLYLKMNPLGELQQTASVFVVVLVALILSFVIRHKDLKKITAYHVLFAILAGIAFYYAPLALSSALAMSSYDLWLRFFYSLWIVITVIIARFFLREKLSAVAVAGLCTIIAAYSIRLAFIHFI